MAYRKPSVAVYQDLENSGGAAQVTPDLRAVIIGPLFNEVTIVPSDDRTLAKAKSTEVDHWFAPGDAKKMIDLTLNAQSTYPGQKVLDDGSIQVFLMNAEVFTYHFKADGLTFVEPISSTEFTVDLAGNQFGLAGDNPLAELPLGGLHVQQGDRMIVKGDKTIETTVSKVTLEGTSATFSVTDSLAEATGAVEVYIYHRFAQLPLNIARVDTANVDISGLLLGNEVLKISNTYAVLNTKDNAYTLRSPAQSGGEPIQTYIGYRAQRTDKSREIVTVTGTPGDLESKLGEATTTNPLAKGVELALANSGGTSIQCIALETDDLQGYQKALNLCENERVYAIAPLTSQMDVITTVNRHVAKMSDPITAKWRVAIVSTDPSDILALGEFDGDFDLTKSSIGDAGGRHNMLLTVPKASFLSSGIQPGDTLEIRAATDKLVEGSFRIDKVYSNTVIGVKSGLAGEAGYIPEIETKVQEFAISRFLDSKAKADNIAEISKSFKSNRVWHIMPCLAGVMENKVEKFIPSYFISAALAGAVAGFPVQQGFTNISLAGFTSLRNSNFYFTNDELNHMAEFGTCIYVQDNQSSAPYCRHELTTDMTTLEYREMLKVKNWDWLSYAYYDLLDQFIGHWNIVDDTIITMRQTIVSMSEMLMSQKLPKIGPPLVSYEIMKLEQNDTQKDKIDCYIRTGIVDPNNYTDIHLVI